MVAVLQICVRAQSVRPVRVSFFYLQAQSASHAWIRRWLGRHGFDRMDFQTFADRIGTDTGLRDHVLRHTYFMPQVRWLRLDDDRMEMDFIGRFETLVDDFARLRDRLGRDRTLMHVRKGVRQNYDALYDRPRRCAVEAIYADDFAAFGY